MFILRSREEIESLLRTELEAAERRLREATSDQVPEARQCFKQALRRFTVLVMHGEVPDELRYVYPLHAGP